MNPVPIAPTFNDETDITIAVNLGGPVDITKEMVDKNPPSASKSSPLREKVDHFISQQRTSAKNSDDKEWGVFDVANQAFDAMQSTIARQKLAAYPPDIVIEIARNACGTLDFDRAARMIELGRVTAREHLSQKKNHDRP